MATGSPATDRLAERIAMATIAWQRAIAAKANLFINRYPRSSQKKLLWIFCLCWVAVLCFSLYQLYQGTGIAKTENSYQPVHIGQPFDLPKPITKLIKPTDSLTFKK